MQATRGTPLTDLPVRGPVAPTRPRRLGWLLAAAIAVAGLDQLTKQLLLSTRAGRPPLHVVGRLLELEVTRNSGAAFSLAAGDTVVFSVVALAVVVVILRSARRLRSGAWALCLGLILGGATGNLIDRIFRAPGPLRGWVVDWIRLPHWPVFNLADSAIVVGAVLAVLLSARGVPMGEPADRS